jgi:hypothetical protein
VDELFERAAPYFKILEADDTDLGALTNLGTLLYTGGYPAAGRRALARAAQLHPGDPLARVNAGNVWLDDEDAPQARAEFEAALAIDGSFALAHRGLAILFARVGDDIAVRRHARYLRNLPLPLTPCRGDAPPLRMLLLVSAIGGNVDTQGLIDDRTFERHTLIVELYDATMALAQVDLVFNAIGDADRCADALDRAGAIVARVRAPVVNDPAAVRATGRAENARRLSAIPGVVAPPTVAMSRSELLSSGAPQSLTSRGILPPFLVRASGFHTGRNLCKVERFEDLSDALASLPGDRFFAIAFVDLREPDGNLCKYRAMFVDGEILPLHCAVSPDWNVHYYTAGMETSAERRARDAAFVADMNVVLGARALAALEGVRDLLALDYGGIDFAIDERGEVVVFEANATMVVPSPAGDERFAYRNPAAQRVLTVVKNMLVARARTANV